MKKYKCESVRLCRYLYSLGFDKESYFENKKLPKNNSSESLSIYLT